MKKILIILGLFIGLGINAQNIWHVNNITGMGPDGTGFLTFSEAYEAASNGDIIYVQGSGQSYGSATIEKQLTIIGPGYYLEENGLAEGGGTAFGESAKFYGIFLEEGSQGSNIIGLEVSYSTGSGGSNQGIKINVGNITVYGCRANIDIGTYSEIVSNVNIENSVCLISIGVNVSSFYLYNNIMYYITTADLPSFTGAGLIEHSIISYFANTKNTIYKNNILADYCNGNSGFRDDYSSNTYFNNISTCINDDLPENNGNQKEVDLNTLFVGYPEADNGYSEDAQFQLAPGSPAAGAGMNGEDCGIFGGADPYVLSGLPSIPTIYELNIPSFAPDDNNLPVEVKVKSNN